MEKRLVLICVFLGFSAGLFAKPLVIQGYMHSKLKDSLYLFTYKNTGDYLIGMSPVYAVKPDTNGFFRFVYPIKTGKEFTLKHGNEYVFFNVYFQPGDSLKINLEAHAVHYDGNAKNNVAYNDSFPRIFYMGEEGKIYSNASKMSLDSFNTYIDNRKTERYHFLQKFSDKHPLSDAFIDQTNKEIEYQWAVDKMQYLWKHNYFLNKRGVVEAPQSYFDFISKLDIRRKPELNVLQYYYCLKDYPTEIWEEKLYRNPYKDRYKFENQIRARLQVIDSMYKGKIKMIAYAQIIEDVLKWPGTKDNDAKIQFTDSLLDILKKDRYAKRLDLYNPMLEEKNRSFSLLNKQAPDFILKNLNDSLVSLSDFKGKVVLLDFWSVNCGPCIKEIPNANLLQEKLKGKDFVEVAVCFDSDKKEWKDMIAKKQWKGIHLFDNFDQRLKDRYFFNSYPHYILIDRHGIVRESNASENMKNLELRIRDLLKN